MIGLIERLIENAKQSLAFIDSSCLVKRTIRRVMTFRKTKNQFENVKKPFEELHLLIYSETITGNRLPNQCNRLHKAFM